MSRHLSREPRPIRLDWDRISQTLTEADAKIQSLIAKHPPQTDFQLVSSIQSVSLDRDAAEIAAKNIPLFMRLRELHQFRYMVGSRYDFVLLQATRPITRPIEKAEFETLDRFTFLATTTSGLEKLGRIQRLERNETGSAIAFIGYPLVIPDITHFSIR